MAKPPAGVEYAAMSLDALTEYLNVSNGAGVDCSHWQPAMDAALAKIETQCLADGKVRNFALEINTSMNGNQFRNIANSNAPLFDTAVINMDMLSRHVHNLPNPSAKPVLQQVLDDILIRVDEVCKLDHITRQVAMQIDPTLP